MAEESRAGRRWRPWLWAALGVLGLGIVIGLVRPFVSPLSSHHERDGCRSQLRNVAMACHLYADENDGWMPTVPELLHPVYLDYGGILKCRGDRSGAASSYTLVPDLRADMPSDLILAYETSLANHGDHGRNVAFIDTSSKWWPAGREAEFQRRLAEQAEKVRNWKPPAASAEEVR